MGQTCSPFLEIVMILSPSLSISNLPPTCHAPPPAMGNQLGKGRDPGEEKAKAPRNGLGAALPNVHMARTKVAI